MNNSDNDNNNSNSNNNNNNNDNGYHKCNKYSFFHRSYYSLKYLDQLKYRNVYYYTRIN